MSGNEIFAKVKPSLAGLFPLGGMVNNPKVGQRLNLGFIFVGDKHGPVEVTEVGERHFALKSLPGHIEGADNTINFSFSAEGEELRVVADGPKEAPALGKLLPQPFWQTFAQNISYEIHPYQGFPGAENEIQ